ncbi:MAG TPA: winged helix DNA-binding domain-containing protein [Gaiellaceae bacterium]|nr:winged helix DNA-binding domain-containing protein [Gaiellaceae bacterium]
MAERTLTQRELNRALLARQLLLTRARLPLARALERIGGIQAQYAPSSYVRLWTNLDGFARQDLTRALERKRVVQGTLMRSTIHLVSPRDYWLFSAGVGPSREAHWLRTWGKGQTADELAEAREGLRAALAGRTVRRDELKQLLDEHGQSVWAGAWIETIREPPSGTWERRRADLFRLAADWIPPATPSEEQGVEHLLRRYLAAFGPARLADAASWAGVPPARMRETAARLGLHGFRDEQGKRLVDLPRAPLPGDVPAPARFLPTWDATLLVHARRTHILPEQYRERVFHVRNPQSVSTFLVDGTVAGTWRVEPSERRATVVVEPFERLRRADAEGLRAEGTGLAAFYEPELTPAVRFTRAG